MPRRVTQGELAREIGISPSQLSSFLNDPLANAPTVVARARAWLAGGGLQHSPRPVPAAPAAPAPDPPDAAPPPDEMEIDSEDEFSITAARAPIEARGPPEPAAAAAAAAPLMRTKVPA